MTATMPMSATSPVPPAAAHGRQRDPYLDLLRAVALVRVVTYHAFGWAWLSLLFPSMGVMFALAGSLMARSLDRPAVSVVRGRMRRLLLPFWLFGALVVGAMLLHGWGPGREEDGLAWWSRLLFWIVPLADPPANAWAFQVTGPLWYVRTYVWFVLLSPVLLPTFRRLPWASVLGFLGVAVVAQPGSSFVPESLETVATNLTDLATFGACWLLGFAHRDGLVDRLPAAWVSTLAVVGMAIGGWFTFTHPTEDGYDLGEIPLGQAFWSLGFVLLLLRFRPDPRRWFGHLVSWRPVAAVVNLFNARAVTVYLWHEVALVASVLVIDAMWDVPLFEEVLPLDSAWFSFAVAWPLIAVAIVAVGWVEDLAARRRRRLWPTRDLTPSPRLG
ncbi:acyltransferase [Actinopolymorpha sp. B17G11]|uniref:acyltransferase family protein n=1 Tax=Actinopolymorpha sp. B17G11 TaxID=3160861 RepID=UPI0032E47A80